jgi:hypothetical protein
MQREGGALHGQAVPEQQEPGTEESEPEEPELQKAGRPEQERPVLNKRKQGVQQSTSCFSF